MSSYFTNCIYHRTGVNMKENSRYASNVNKSSYVIGGKTVYEWEDSWSQLGLLSSATLSNLSDLIGLYRAKLDEQIVYVGRAVEYSNGGMRKRLSDYTRKSDSARKHKSGKLMHENANQLLIDILITGCNSDAVTTTKKLEEYFIRLYRPKWNVMFK